MNSWTFLYNSSGSFMFFIAVLAKSNCSWKRLALLFIVWMITAIVPSMLALIIAAKMNKRDKKIIWWLLTGVTSPPKRITSE